MLGFKPRTCIAASLAAACSGNPERPRERALVDAEEWEVATAAADFFAHLRPPDVVCSAEEGYGFDHLGGQPSFEINTGGCNYLTIVQPTLATIASGDPIELGLWHFDLTSTDAAADAFVGVAIGTEMVGELTIPIPTSSGLITQEFDAPADAPAGTLIQFHLNNHGINTWNLLSISVTN